MSDIVAVHQLLPSLHVHDASGAHTLHARDALRDAGFESELFVEHVDAPLAAEARPFTELDRWVRPDRTALLYQLAVGSAMVDQLLLRPEPLLVNYHNLTPAGFFWQWAPDWLDAVQMGRNQLVALASRTRTAIAVSEFNRADLVAVGYRDTVVVPPFVDTEAFADSAPGGCGARAGAGSAERARSRVAGPAGGGAAGAGATAGGPVGVGAAAGRSAIGGAGGSPGATASPRKGARWLFVGKVLPHKAFHDVIKAFACYRHTYDADARLLLIGGTPVASYAEALAGFVAEAGLSDAVELAGSVGHHELAAAYRSADVFVCLSDHEGFCFPLLEAMHHRLPVVAYAAGAVAETVGAAGVVLPKKAPATVAAAVHRVVTDPVLRTRLEDAGTARLAAFSLDNTKAAFVGAVRRSLAGAGGAPALHPPLVEAVPAGGRP